MALTILDTSGKTYLIVDSQDGVITATTLDEMIEVVRAIGCKSGVSPAGG